MNTKDMEIRDRVMKEIKEEVYVQDADEPYEEWFENLLIGKTIRITKEVYKA